MNPDDFDAVFDTFHHAVFRLEALPAYDVGGADAERMNAFLAGRALPERSVCTSPWLARMAVSTVVAGRRWERVRVVDDPLTEYQAYELRAYQESQAVGERVLILPRTRAGNWGPDFWLFDTDTSNARAVLMDYAPDGRWLGVELVGDPKRVAVLADIRREAMEAATPLNEFLAAVRA